MKLLHLKADVPVLQAGTAAVIGNFDGVHRGHQALLTALRNMASQAKLPMLVIVFEPQTREYFLKEQSPPRLTSLRKKLQIFQQFDVNYVCCLRFNHHVASMSAVEFAEKIIFSRLKVKHLYVGKDFRFGHDRLGDAHLLQKIGQTHQAQVTVAADVILDHNRVSSTLIRQALQAGHLQEAERWLGRTFSICGRVIYGDAQARIWGIPTANIKLSKRPLPVYGVFFVKVKLPDNSVWFGVANVGCRPTLDGQKNLLEIHIFNFSGSLYGERLEVFFLHKLRNEQKFASKDELIAQIHADVAAARAYFNL